jgi:hypothetical protein
MEMIFFPEMSIDFQRTTRRYIPEFFAATATRILNPPERESVSKKMPNSRPR